MTEPPLRVLFLDGRPEGLAQLRRYTADRAGRWEMTFAATAEEASAAIDAGPVDVLVASVDDPSSDGARLLDDMRDRCPRMARIALSQRSDRGAVVKSLGAIHRHLGRLCEASVLTRAVEQAGTYARLLATEETRALAGRLRSMPTPGAVVTRVLAELNSPTASAAGLAGIIAEDPALTAQLLRVVNSPAFGMANEVTSAFTAVTLLGFDTIGALCVGTRLLSGLDRRALVRAGLTSLFAHSVRTGDLARLITLEVAADESAAATALAAGVLHDFGKLALAADFGAQLASLPASATATAEERREAERREFGVTHDRFGGYLLGLWGVPLSIVEAVAFHHEPSAHPGATFTPLTAVHVANALDHGVHGADPWPVPGLDADHLTRVGLPIDHPAWPGIVRELRKEDERTVLALRR